MNWNRTLGFFAGLAFFAGAGFMLNYSGGDNFGLVISAQDLNADDTAWTGWLYMHQSQDLVLQVDLTDADSGVTLTARCEGSQINAEDASGTTEDAGFEVCGYTYNAGTQTYTCPLVKSLATHGSTKMKWTFADVDSKWVNCLFTSSGDGAADALTVYAYGVAK